MHKNLKPVPNLNILALRLRQARLQAGLSQEKLGILAGIDEFSASSRVNQYERGKHVPDFQMMERFAEVLEVPLPYFYAKNDGLAEHILKYEESK